MRRLPQRPATRRDWGCSVETRTLTPETSQNFDFGCRPLADRRTWALRSTITESSSRTSLEPFRHRPFTVIPPSSRATTHVNNAGGLTPSIQEATSCVPHTAPTCGYINLQNQNTGRITTDGFDLSIQYLQRTDFGTFHEDLEGTAVTQFLQQQYNGGPELNLVGWYNELPPAYRWQHNLRIDWTSPGGMWGAGLDNRFYSSYATSTRMAAAISVPWAAIRSLMVT